MTPERWRQIETIYYVALERTASERSVFLDEACADDVELRREVESLLASHEEARGFLASPALELAAQEIAVEQSKIPAESFIAHYHILSPLGKGGMGEVYLAEDIRLSRKIALKLLPGYLSQDADRLRRFSQEARAASALNHPNIITIYEIGHIEEKHFIAMEYVSGVTLRQHIANTQMKIGEALDIAIQVASALSAAHEAGIVHRDIKPENIMLRRDGYIKVLDFGLAKPIKLQQTDANAQTWAMVETSPGVLMGTLSYMSPEQVRGLAVDMRTDIWSLGIVLFEMFTRRVPFEGETTSDVIVSILEHEPPPMPKSTEIPEELERIVMKSLRKDREERQQTVKELLTELKSLKQRLDFRDELKRYAEISKTTEVLETSAIKTQSLDTDTMRVAILYKRNAHPDEEVLNLLETHLTAQGHKVFIDRHLTIGVEWAKEIERQIREADAVVVLLSAASVMSEMLAYEVEIAHQTAQQTQSKPRLLPVRVNYTGPLPVPLTDILAPLHQALWSGPQDNQNLVNDLIIALRNHQQLVPSLVQRKLEPIGGAVPLDSEFYIVRPTDEEFSASIALRDSVVLIKGARQMGKTSLLARGLQQSREAGAKVILTDFQKLNAIHLQSSETLFMALAEMIADQLDLKVFPEDVWSARRGPSANFERYVKREILDHVEGQLVWGMDEVDRLFTYNYASEVFGLFRSWHNERALDPTGPWQRLTLAIAYATEAHLFITDLNQSPFNVGTRLTLDDFTLEQVVELNRRYSSPLTGPTEVARFYRLLNGQPYLVRRGLNEMATRGTRLADFEIQAARDEGPFGDHLRRVLALLAQDAALCEAMRVVLRGQPCPTMESFYRLRSAGVLSGDSARDAQPRCQLYATYLERHLL